MRGGPGGRYSQVAMVSLVQKLSFETLFFKLLEFCLAGRISEHAGSKGQKCFTSGKRDQNILSVILKGKMKTKRERFQIDYWLDGSLVNVWFS